MPFALVQRIQQRQLYRTPGSRRYENRRTGNLRHSERMREEQHHDDIRRRMPELPDIDIRQDSGASRVGFKPNRQDFV